jgi:hypothetical protein
MKVDIKIVSIIEPGAFGVLLINDIPIGVILMRTYESLAVKIPPGLYRCTRTKYFKGGYETFEIHVPGHSRILFHKANIEDDLDGCVGIGEQFGELHGKPAILQSGSGFAEFMDKMTNYNEFILKVA